MNRTQIQFANEFLEIHADRTLWWDRCGVLFVADLHLGAPNSKGNSAESTRTTLERFGKVIRHRQPDVVCILGDLVHATMEWTSEFNEELKSLRLKNARQRWLLIEGNHDCRWRQPIRNLSIDVQTPPQFFDPFWLTHDAKGESTLIPVEPTSAIFTLSAHLHPCVECSVDGTAPIRRDCFWVMPSQIVLPSFALGRATRPIQPQPGDRLFMVDDGEIMRWEPNPNARPATVR